MANNTPGYMPVDSYHTARRVDYSGGARVGLPFQSYFGAYKVTGTTVRASDSNAYAALVQIAPEAYPQNVLQQVRTTALNNTYTFLNLASGSYIVTAIDETGALDAAAHALVVAVAM